MEPIVIEPDRSWLHVPWREIWHYRDLLYLLVRRNFVTTYKQTVLGPAWAVINPILTTLVFTVVFGRIAKISTDELPHMLFYLCGMLGWGLFARCVQGTSSTLTGNAGLFGKVYFPRLIVPLSAVVTGLIPFAIQFASFMGFWIYFKCFTAAGALIRMHAVVLLLPAMLLIPYSMGLGVGLWMSSLTVKYRDLSFVLGFFTRMWLYLTPVIYPLSTVPEKWHWLAALNPMAVVVEWFRYAFLGKGTVYPAHMATAVAIAAVALASGVMMFNRTERTFIDTV